VTVLVLHRVKISCDCGTNNRNDSDTRVVGNLRDPIKCSRDILLQAKGSPGSSPLRSDGSRDEQAGEAGPVEQGSAEAKRVSKLRPRDCLVATPVGNNRGIQTGGQKAKIKNYSHDELLKETGLKVALTGTL
jgi:hypothetical protein